MNPRLLARFSGVMLMFEAAFMASSIIWAVYDADFDAIQNFVVATGVTAAVGFLIWRWGKAVTVEIIHPREAVATVTGVWLMVGVFGAIPYMLEGAFNNWPSALFESISGFTTTGASAFGDVEALSRPLLWWRSITHWMGGMGIIVMFIAVFPRLGLGAVHLFRSEAAGPITEKLRPKLRQTSLILWYIYMGFTVAEAGILMLFGLTPFDALTHSFATMATGGFSTLNLSVAGFNSLAVEITILVFMILAGVNFGLYFRLARGDWRAVYCDPELRAYIIIMTIGVTLVSVAISPMKESIWTALRHGSFAVATVQTETGFATDDYNLYPDFARLLLIGLMIVGGCAGSTSGGIKISRLLVAGRAFVNDLIRSFRPHAVLAVRVGGVAIDSNTVREVALYIGAYLMLMLVGGLALSAMGLGIMESLTASASALGNCGPGLGAVGPMANYSLVPSAAKLLLAGLMVLGRLEILTVLALFVPSFWRK
jgi:trk system potassium uptake protein